MPYYAHCFLLLNSFVWFFCFLIDQKDNSPPHCLAVVSGKSPFENKLFFKKLLYQSRSLA